MVINAASVTMPSRWLSGAAQASRYTKGAPARGDGTTGEIPVNEEAIELDRKPGRIEVSPRAISMAAARVVLDCYGVVGIAGRKLRHGRAILLEDHDYHQGIVVSVRADEVVVDVYVVIEYGTRISEVAHNVMHAVRDTLCRMLGTRAVRVNVNVQGLRISG